MIEFSDALKKSKAFRLIQNDIENAMAHAYLITATDEDIVLPLFRLVACRIFCETQNACLECRECQKILDSVNPDVIELNAQKQTIKVGAINELVDSAHISSVSGVLKLYFINCADCMTGEAQNKLLKTLEEPPDGVILFLGTAKPAALLDTVKSRCRTVPVEAFDYQTVYDEIYALTSDEKISSIAAACSEGKLYAAKHIASSPEYVETFSAVLDMLDSVKKSSDISAFIGSNKAEKNAPEFLDALSVILRDILASDLNDRLVLTMHVKDKIEKLKSEFSPMAAAQCIFAVNEAKAKLKLNVGVQVVLERMLFKILEVKYKCR